MEKCPNHPSHEWQALSLADGRLGTFCVCVHCGAQGPMLVAPDYPAPLPMPSSPPYPIPPYWGWGEYPLVPSPVLPWYVPKITYTNGANTDCQTIQGWQQ